MFLIANITEFMFLITVENAFKYSFFQVTLSIKFCFLSDPYSIASFANLGFVSKSF